VAKFDLDVNVQTSATSISGKLTSLTYGRSATTACTSTLPVNYSDCQLHGTTLPSVTITSTAGGGTVVLGDTVIRCQVVGAANACYYTWPTALGQTVNATSTISFSGVTIVATGNPAGTTDGFAAGVCGTSATFSVAFTHIVQGGTNRTVTITTA
jgi:hypothetical protein